jgi:hypothetical protein
LKFYREKPRRKFEDLVSGIQNTGHLLISEGFKSMRLNLAHDAINVWERNTHRKCLHRSFIKAPQLLLGTSILTDQKFVHSSPDFIHIHNNLDHIVKYHKISVVIGLGINGSKNSGLVFENLPFAQKSFLAYLLKEQTLIGCRGLETLEFLSINGFPRSNLFLSGCPSSQLVRRTPKDIPPEFSRISVNGALVNRLDLLSSMTTPDTKILVIPQTLESLSNVERFSATDKRIEIFLPDSLSNWKAKLEKWNPELSLGTRLHGNILAMALEIPTIFMSGDIRTREISQLTGLPFADDLVEIGVALEIFKEDSKLDVLGNNRYLRSQIIENLDSSGLVI